MTVLLASALMLVVLALGGITWRRRRTRLARRRQEEWREKVDRAKTARTFYDLEREARLLQLEADEMSCAVEQLIRETSGKRPA